MNFFEYDAELSISTQAAMDYYDNFSKELERKSLDDQRDRFKFCVNVKN